MTTARAKLHAELVEAFAKKGKSVDALIDAVLDQYRIQFKNPRPAGEEKQTARNVLREALLVIQRRPGKDLLGQIAAAIDDYRMQSKPDGDVSTKTNAKKAAAAPGKKARAVRDVIAAAAPETEALPHQNPLPPPAAPGPVVSPRPRTKTVKLDHGDSAKRKRATRSECPKCHSLGVVLARSYASDEYFSCIYCGWQGYKAAEALEAQDSLAARLLGIYSNGIDNEDDNI